MNKQSKNWSGVQHPLIITRYKAANSNQRQLLKVIIDENNIGQFVLLSSEFHAQERFYYIVC